MSSVHTRYEMSEDHKAQLALGREQSRVVRNYLEALRLNAPKRGRKRSPLTVKAQLERVETQLANGAEPLRKLHLMADRDRLVRELQAMEEKPDLSEIEREFVQVARAYSTRKGITYAAWRALGVPAAILRQAGINRAA